MKKLKVKRTEELEELEKLREEAEKLELEKHGHDTYEKNVEILQGYEEGLKPRSFEEFSESHSHDTKKGKERMKD